MTIHRKVAPRSRKIWNGALKPGAPPSSLLRAVLYELQPLRFSTVDTSSLGTTGRALLERLRTATEGFPTVAVRVCAFLRDRSGREWSVALGVFGYWRAVVFLHRTMEAGPIALILTALIAIFTFGLSDGTGASTADGRMSAYAVFNRGFESMMGGVDVENLIAQHAGGGGGALAFQQQRMQRGEEDGRWEDGDEGVDDLQPDDDVAVADAERRPENRSRRSNKKGRRKRRNLELKNDMQRQRDAAAAMGFGAGGDGDDVNEMMAMNRLVEDQANGGDWQDDFGDSDEEDD